MLYEVITVLKEGKLVGSTFTFRSSRPAAKGSSVQVTIGSRQFTLTHTMDMPESTFTSILYEQKNAIYEALVKLEGASNRSFFVTDVQGTRYKYSAGSTRKMIDS